MERSPHTSNTCRLPKAQLWSSLLLALLGKVQHARSGGLATTPSIPHSLHDTEGIGCTYQVEQGEDEALQDKGARKQPERQRQRGQRQRHEDEEGGRAEHQG